MIRRGFTLLEILIVVGLIALLSSLLVIGLNHLQTNSKRQQTMMTLVSLQGMYSDYDALFHRHFVSWKDLQVANGYTNVDLPCPQNVSLDFFNSAGTGTISPDRQGWAVLMTRDVMGQFKLTSTNTATIGKMSPTSLMRFTQSTTAAPTLFANTNPYTMTNRVYVVNAGVYTYYTCIQFNPTLGSPPVSDSPPDPNFWFPSTYFGNNATVAPSPAADESAPVALDAWGNPIIFVPGGSLGSASNLPIAVGSGILEAGGISTRVRSPDGRPFFASAGPDGDFSLGDDNLYSFEK